MFNIIYFNINTTIFILNAFNNSGLIPDCSLLLPDGSGFLLIRLIPPDDSRFRLLTAGAARYRPSSL